MTEHELELMAQGWDAAVAAMRYEDGTPVEIVAMVNPYRLEAATRSASPSIRC